MKRKSTYLYNMPKHIDIKPLYTGTYDVYIAEDISHRTQPSMDFIRKPEIDTVEKQNMVDVYDYTLYNDTVKAVDYTSFISSIIHVRYSVDDEIALINKGILDSENVEYQAYRLFVEEVKNIAKQHFNSEE